MISDRYKNDAVPTLNLNEIQIEKKRQIEDKIKFGQYSFESVSCGVCSQDDFIQLSKKDRYGLECFNVICKECGLVQISPRMNGSSYNEFYNEEYRALYTGKLANAKAFFEGQLVRGKRLFKYLSTKNLLPNSDKFKPFVLEIGCGAGGILSYFRDKGFEVQGIDLGQEYLGYGKKIHGLNLEVGSLEELRLDEKPDVIIYSHVLEHILDLSTELENVKKICSKDTVIYVEVPGLKNIAQGYRSDLLRYFQNAHTYSFTLRTLKNLFHKHGFELICGDEFVKSVFRVVKSSESPEIVSDFKSVTKFIERSEWLRKFYNISFARLKMIIVSLLQKYS